jgi:DNA helicase-2/ATP-dependent DNA helicase PcrA
MVSDSVRVRAPGKPELTSGSSISGEYPAVMAIVDKQNTAAANKMRDLIDALMVNGYVTNYAQIALLTFSTRETTRSIQAYVKALRDAGVPVVNPRNHRAHEDPRIKEMLGALSSLLDPQFGEVQRERLPRSVITYIEECREAYQSLIATEAYAELAAYVTSSAQAVANSKLREEDKPTWLVRHGGREVRLSGLFFKLLAHQPFALAITDPETGERLKALDTILTDYESIYDDGRLRLAENPEEPGKVRIAPDVLYSLYAVFFEGISGGLNDPEDEEVSVQPGAINVMTIHQAKGLEFEVVFVLRPDKYPFLGDTHLHEDLLDPYIERPLKLLRREGALRAREDAIRLFFVAYSRAKRLLVLTGTDVAKWDLVLGRAEGGSPINSVEALKGLGVLCL